MMKEESKGLGDTIAKITEFTGIKTIVDKTTELLGIEDCGCNRRRDILNNLIPYGNNLTPQEVTEQPEDDLKYGIYVFQKMSIIDNDPYNIGDRIYIENENDINKFRELFKLGVIIHES